MTNDRHGLDRRSRFHWLLLASVLALVLVTPASALTGQTATRSAAVDGDTATTGRAPASNASLSVSVDGPAIVHRSRFVYAWSRERLDATVSLGASVTATRLCLYRIAGSEAVDHVRCRALDDATDERTLRFESVGRPDVRPATYRLEARSFDAANRTTATAASNRVVELLNWSAVENETLDDYAADRGLLAESDERTATPEQTTTERPSPPDDRNESTPGTDSAGPTGTDGATPAAAQNFSNAGIERNGSLLPDVGALDTVPGLDDRIDPPVPPVLVLSGGGLLALLALLYVQRGEPTDEEPEGIDGKRTDADVVVSLLLENGGRLKQSEIVEATGWSKAKVSRLLSRMDDHDEIRKRQDGRQNIIILRGRD